MTSTFQQFTENFRLTNQIKEIPDFESVGSQMSRVKSAEVQDVPQDIDDVNIKGSWAQT